MWNVIKRVLVSMHVSREHGVFVEKLMIACTMIVLKSEYTDLNP